VLPASSSAGSAVGIQSRPYLASRLHRMATALPTNAKTNKTSKGVLDNAFTD
jgi:hypothetical protein